MWLAGPATSSEAQGRTPQQMEAGNETAWRKGNPPQRWWEYTVLLSAIEAKQVELTTSTRRPADFMAAAAAVDTQAVTSRPQEHKGPVPHGLQVLQVAHQQGEGGCSSRGSRCCSRRCVEACARGLVCVLME